MSYEEYEEDEEDIVVGNDYGKSAYQNAQKIRDYLTNMGIMVIEFSLIFSILGFTALHNLILGIILIIAAIIFIVIVIFINHEVVQRIRIYLGNYKHNEATKKHSQIIVEHDDGSNNMYDITAKKDPEEVFLYQDFLKKTIESQEFNRNLRNEITGSEDLNIPEEDMMKKVIDIEVLEKDEKNTISETEKKPIENKIEEYKEDNMQVLDPEKEREYKKKEMKEKKKKAETELDKQEKELNHLIISKILRFWNRMKKFFETEEEYEEKEEKGKEEKEEKKIKFGKKKKIEEEEELNSDPSNIAHFKTDFLEQSEEEEEDFYDEIEETKAELWDIVLDTLKESNLVNGDKKIIEALQNSIFRKIEDSEIVNPDRKFVKKLWNVLSEQKIHLYYQEIEKMICMDAIPDDIIHYTTNTKIDIEYAKNGEKRFIEQFENRLEDATEIYWITRRDISKILHSQIRPHPTDPTMNGIRDAGVHVAYGHFHLITEIKSTPILMDEVLYEQLYGNAEIIEPEIIAAYQIMFHHILKLKTRLMEKLAAAKDQIQEEREKAAQIETNYFEKFIDTKDIINEVGKRFAFNKFNLTTLLSCIVTAIGTFGLFSIIFLR